MVVAAFEADAKGVGAFVAIGGYAPLLPPADVDCAAKPPKAVGAFWELGGSEALLGAVVFPNAPNGVGAFEAIGGYAPAPPELTVDFAGAPPNGVGAFCEIGG